MVRVFGERIVALPTRSSADEWNMIDRTVAGHPMFEGWPTTPGARALYAADQDPTWDGTAMTSAGSTDRGPPVHPEYGQRLRIPRTVAGQADMDLFLAIDLRNGASGSTRATTARRPSMATILSPKRSPR